MRLQSILCPIDFSEPSRDGLRLALDVARRSGGAVTVLFVNDPILLTVAAAAIHRSPQFARRSVAELERFVEGTVTAPTGRPRVSCRVAEGNPAGEILRAATRFRSDLMVMGTHGLSGFDRLFFGSTTGKVLRCATMPVLAVPPSKNAGTIRRIVAPLDLEGERPGELTEAVEMARLFDAELLLAHVVPRIQAPPWLQVDIAAQDRRRLAKAREAVERIKGKVPPDVRTAISVVVGNPSDQIIRLAAKGLPSLVVMALRGGRRARRGSTTDHVLTRAIAPVLAVPRL